MKTLIVTIFGGGAMLATALPIDDLAKLGVSGGCLFVLWWTIAKTMPDVAKRQSEALANITSVHGETTDKLCAHLDKVEAAIHQAAQSESQLLRQLIADSRK